MFELIRNYISSIKNYIGSIISSNHALYYACRNIFSFGNFILIANAIPQLIAASYENIHNNPHISRIKVFKENSAILGKHILNVLSSSWTRYISPYYTWSYRLANVISVLYKIRNSHNIKLPIAEQVKIVLGSLSNGVGSELPFYWHKREITNYSTSQLNQFYSDNIWIQSLASNTLGLLTETSVNGLIYKKDRDLQNNSKKLSPYYINLIETKYYTSNFIEKEIKSFNDVLDEKTKMFSKEEIKSMLIDIIISYCHDDEFLLSNITKKYLTDSKYLSKRLTIDDIIIDSGIATEKISKEFSGTLKELLQKLSIKHIRKITLHLKITNNLKYVLKTCNLLLQQPFSNVALAQLTHSILKNIPSYLSTKQADDYVRDSISEIDLECLESKQNITIKEITNLSKILATVLKKSNNISDKDLVKTIKNLKINIDNIITNNIKLDNSFEGFFVKIYKNCQEVLKIIKRDRSQVGLVNIAKELSLSLAVMQIAKPESFQIVRKLFHDNLLLEQVVEKDKNTLLSGIKQRAGAILGVIAWKFNEYFNALWGMAQKRLLRFLPMLFPFAIGTNIDDFVKFKFQMPAYHTLRKIYNLQNNLHKINKKYMFSKKSLGINMPDISSIIERRVEHLISNKLYIPVENIDKLSLETEELLRNFMSLASRIKDCKQPTKDFSLLKEFKKHSKSLANNLKQVVVADNKIAISAKICNSNSLDWICTIQTSINELFRKLKLYEVINNKTTNSLSNQQRRHLVALLKRLKEGLIKNRNIPEDYIELAKEVNYLLFYLNRLKEKMSESKIEDQKTYILFIKKIHSINKKLSFLYDNFFADRMPNVKEFENQYSEHRKKYDAAAKQIAIGAAGTLLANCC